jgi:hypothetical protein
LVDRSCEPCRKIKMRCDHHVPPCGRCQSRGISHQCYYHPAPLTRRLEQDNNASNGNHSLALPSPVDALPDLITDGRTQEHACNITWSHQIPAPRTLDFSKSTTDLMSAATPSILSPESNPTPSCSGYVGTLAMECETQVSEILSCLKQFEMISVLVQRWYDFSEMCLLPSAFIIEALSCTKLLAQRLSHHDVQSVADVLRATLRPLETAADHLASDFLKLFIGPNLRLEIIGVLFATAGLAALKLPYSDPVLVRHFSKKAEHKTFAAKMLSASDTCLVFCDSWLIANDITIWLRSENLALTSHVYGKTSKHRIQRSFHFRLLTHLVQGQRVWHRSDALFSNLFALDIHKQPAVGLEKVPLFLGEIRSRFFATAYRIDKALATAYEQQPRLPQSFCQLRLPLHIPNDLLAGPEKTLQDAIDALGEDGWSSQGGLHPATWLRARSVFSALREQFLLVKLGPVDQYRDITLWYPSPLYYYRDAKADEVIRSTLQSVHDAWNQLPSYVRYESSCWDADTSSNVCFMLLVVYLEYLDIVFLIEETLYTNDDSRLLKAAGTLLCTAVSSSRHMSRTAGNYTDYVWMVSRPSPRQCG